MLGTQGGCSTCGRGALACVDGWTGYPHVGNQTMYVVHPLHVYVGGVLRKFIWTNNASLLSTRPDFFYLPAVLMHEFGHTAGLGHGSVAGDVMYSPFGRLTTGLSQNDEKAMEANYAGHSSH